MLTCSADLEPAELHIRNVGQVGPMKQRYQSITGSVTLARVGAFVGSSRADQGLVDNTIQRPHSQVASEISLSLLKSVASTGLQSQVDATESLYRKMVRHLETVAHAASP